MPRRSRGHLNLGPASGNVKNYIATALMIARTCGLGAGLTATYVSKTMLFLHRSESLTSSHKCRIENEHSGGGGGTALSLGPRPSDDKSLVEAR